MSEIGKTLGEGLEGSLLEKGSDPETDRDRMLDQEAQEHSENAQTTDRTWEPAFQRFLAEQEERDKKIMDLIGKVAITLLKCRCELDELRQNQRDLNVMLASQPTIVPRGTLEDRVLELEKWRKLIEIPRWPAETMVGDEPGPPVGMQSDGAGGYIPIIKVGGTE